MALVTRFDERGLKPRDYVLATGRSYTVRDFVIAAFEHAGLDWEKHVRTDQRYLRPTEPSAQIGDSSLAARDLGWTARVHTEQLVQIMVDADAEALQHEGAVWVDRPRDWPIA